MSQLEIQGPNGTGSWIVDPGSWIVARGPRFEPWGTPRAHGPVAFWTARGPSKPWGGHLDGHAPMDWPGGRVSPAGRIHARPLNGPWGQKHKMYSWYVCIYLYLGEP